MTEEPKITFGPIHWGSDEIEYRAKESTWLEPLRAFLFDLWGAKCPDYERSCLLCQKWKAFDVLADNPFSEKSITSPCTWSDFERIELLEGLLKRAIETHVANFQESDLYNDIKEALESK